ncbi:histidine kinase [Paenalkalicoccus suaedae]|uniref:histidine kinase n=1 Tax=Paenalkalicoccus suaedae TaxID=2592382 RepID=A0A859FIF7_9BACI|nr:histidine kinase [Paenalkalicoccus suaedae]QKS72504.1 histidine kinase [Paenalkalicoccus suaedae]
MEITTRSWRDLSLRSRIILSSIICILLPIILSFILMNVRIQSDLMDQAVAQSQNTLNTLDIQATTYVNDFLYLSNFLTFSDETKSVLNRNLIRSETGTITRELNALDHLEITRTMEDVVNLLSPAYITIVLQNGFIYTNYQMEESLASNWIDAFEQKRNNDYFNVDWVGVHENYVTNQQSSYPYVISISRVINLSERANALLNISMREEPIQTLLSEATIYPDQELFVVDSDGLVISHSENRATMTPFLYAEALDEGHISTVFTEQRKDYLMVQKPFSYGSWRLVSLVPVDSATSNIQAVTGNVLSFLLFFFLVFLVLLIFMIRVMTHPLARLNRVIKEVKKGNLKVRSGIKGTKDIEQLGESFDLTLDMVEDMILQVKRVEKNKRKAELELLQAQVNPHFLFNILNSLRLKIMLNGDKESAKLIQSLSLLLRMTINRSNEFVSLKEEIELVEHYLDLMNFRSKSNIKLVKHLENDTLAIFVPRFLLQPLIENSINHGFDDKSGTIMIDSELREADMVIRVMDDGKGFAKEDLALIHHNLLGITQTEENNQQRRSFTGIGIKNVYQRLQFMYGEELRVSIDNRKEGGTAITISIPIKREA